MKILSIKEFYMVFIFGAVTAFGVSCNDQNKNKDNKNNKENVVYTGEYTRWIYFSFEKNDTVYVSDPENDLDWDIAFHRWDVKTNGGLSGKGLGAAVKTNVTDINADISNPSDKEWQRDTLKLIYMNRPVMSDTANTEQRVWTSASLVVSDWLSVFMGQIPPVYTLSENVYILRSASGKEYCFKFRDFMNDRAEKGYVSFVYRKQ